MEAPDYYVIVVCEKVTLKMTELKVLLIIWFIDPAMFDVSVYELLLPYWLCLRRLN